jgi:hypothetical protein
VVNYQNQVELKDIVEEFVPVDVDTTKVEHFISNNLIIHIKVIPPQMTIDIIHVDNLNYNSLDFRELLLCDLQYPCVQYPVILYLVTLLSSST